MTVLFVWECGGGLGHVMQMEPLARELARRGENVYMALREPAKAARLSGGAIRLLPAPFRGGRPARPIHPACTFAHILHNVGWDDCDGLTCLVAAWRELFDLVKPDVIIFDHSPTALLASRGLPVRRSVIGSGFCCPPDQTPLPNLRQGTPNSSDFEGDEERLLFRCNKLLDKLKSPPLTHLGQIYGQVCRTFLLTFKELDHYADRPGPTRYWGTWTPDGGIAPIWPAGQGKRVYAYLKSFSALPHLLIRLKGLGCPTTIFADGIEPKLREQIACSTMRFEDKPLNLHEVARQCDVAINNANHGTLSTLLLAGKPMLLLPLHLEQQMLAARVSASGAGVVASPDKPLEIVSGLETLLQSDSLIRRAADFARTYRDHDAASATDAIIEQVQALQRR